MPAKLPDLDAEQRAVLERIYDRFRSGEPWPMFGELDREFDRKAIDLADVLRTIPPAYAFLDRNRLIDPRPDAELQLTLFGISVCPGSENDVALFFDAVRWLARVETEHVIDPKDPSSVEVIATAAAFKEHLAATPWDASVVAVHKIGMLLENEPPGAWQSFGGDGDWQASLRRGIRKYRNLASLDEYLTIVAEAAPQLYGLTQQGASVSDIPGGPSTQDSEGEPLYVFVLMPFEEPWSAAAYALIRRVGASVAADLPLVIERADEIAAPGRITEQIETAIQHAHVVIADITGVNPTDEARNHPNPNVMWELGYAHALQRSVIILNQDPTRSPFDLAVHRQIPYSMSPTSSEEELLERSLRVALDAS